MSSKNVYLNFLVFRVRLIKLHNVSECKKGFKTLVIAKIKNNAIPVGEGTGYCVWVNPNFGRDGAADVGARCNVPLRAFTFLLGDTSEKSFNQKNVFEKTNTNSDNKSPL
jgi:hypothetical protein